MLNSYTFRWIWKSVMKRGEQTHMTIMQVIRASVDALYRDGTCQISRDPHTKNWHDPRTKHLRNCWPSITGGPHPSNICRHDGEFHYDKYSTGRKARRPWHSGECEFACYTLYLIHWSQHGMSMWNYYLLSRPEDGQLSTSLLRTETLLPRTLSWKQELMSTSRTRSEVASIILSSLLPPSLPPSLSVCLSLSPVSCLVLSCPKPSATYFTHPRMRIPPTHVHNTTHACMCITQPRGTLQLQGKKPEVCSWVS